jgi:hypothetical protein
VLFEDETAIHNRQVPSGHEREDSGERPTIWFVQMTPQG